MGCSCLKPLLATALAALACAGANGANRATGATTAASANSANSATSAPGKITGSFEDRKGPISYSADTGDLYQSRQGDRGILRGHVQVSQGDFTVTADQAEATGIGSTNMRWVFTGNVHITSELHGKLSSDRATVEFHEKLPAHALVTGAPAQFEQTSSTTGILAHGHAGTIDYDVTGGVVKLSDSPQLTYGRNDFRGATITYNVRSKEVQMAGDASRRAHSTVVPRPAPPLTPTSAPTPTPTPTPKKAAGPRP